MVLTCVGNLMQDPKLESQYKDFFHRQPRARRGFLLACAGLAFFTLVVAIFGFSTDGGKYAAVLYSVGTIGFDFYH